MREIGCPGGYSLMTPVRTESSDAKFATKSLRAQIHEAGPNPSMKKNRRLLVSIPPYFIIAMLRARPPSRGADAGILCWHHGTYTLYHTSTS